MTNNTYYDFPSPAKLNLFLHILGQRSDGYHNLETAFQFLDYGDTLSVCVTDDSNLVLETPIDGVKNNDNLIIKAALALQQSAECLLGARIRLNKVLPMGGGLGGGSSNAATILLALNHLWQLNYSKDKLAEIGLKLGADVPIFVNGTASFAQGVGERLSPITPKEYWYLVSKPPCHISTQHVFTSTDLPRNTPAIKTKELNIEQYHNDCQTMVIKHYREVAKLLAWLVEYAPSRMTGTGACIFTRFTCENEARKLQAKLPKSVASFVAKGINTSPLLSTIDKIK